MRNNHKHDKFHIFEQWLRDNGAQFSNLELRSEEIIKINNNANQLVQEKEEDASSCCSSSCCSCRETATTEEQEEDEDDDDDDDDDDQNIEEKKDGFSGEQQQQQQDDDDSLEEGNEGESVRNHHHIPGVNTRENGHTQKTNHPKEEKEVEEYSSDEMRGVYARTILPPNTTILSIPKCCLITVEMGQSTPIGQKILLHADTLELDAPKHIYLMIYLLWDKKVHGKSSFFAPYYNILPKSLRNMPIFWNEDEKHYLQGSYLQTQISERLQAIQHDYESICRIAPEFSNIASLHEFQWARMIVCSRNFGLIIHGIRTSALVPHADMLNHYRPRETRWTYCEDTQCFIISTLQQCIEQGAQVYDSYGQKCNHRFLLNYGFCVENNIELDGFCPNEVPVELGMELLLVVPPTEGGGGNNVRWTDFKYDVECWEKKIRFWSGGGEDVVSSMIMASHTDNATSSNTVTTMTRTEEVPSTKRSFASPHRTAAAMTPDKNTTLNTPAVCLSWTKDIIDNISSMNDLSSTIALAETLAGKEGGGEAEDGLNGLGKGKDTTERIAGTDHLLLRRTCVSFSTKRIRVCVSNNENTRILFSLLRVLACDSSELDRILSGRRFGILGYADKKYGSDSGSVFHSIGGGGGNSNSSIAQRMFGTPSLTSTESSPSFYSSSLGSTTTSTRTCQDIRYPISLRNERRAMELLLLVTSRALSQYPTSFHQDTMDLRDEVAYPKFSNKRNAKLQVRGEKEVLHHYELWARTALRVMDIIGCELEMERKSMSSHSSSSLSSSSSSALPSRLVRNNTRNDETSSTTHHEIAETAPNDISEEIRFECVINAMEEDDDCHYTILRYCSDILGAIRRDEFNRLSTRSS